jgi:4-amino-4-deoxy-L-arabinose transferase-like glycosyltransferase
MKKKFQFSIFNFQFISVALILFLAGFMRLYRIADYMTFLGDEGRDVLVVYNILHGHLTLLGPTSSVGGFFLGPIYYYFMAPFLWLFNYDPVGPAVMVALIGVLTVWLVYKVTAEFFNRKVALIAALIYAISPIIVAYSRSSWNPNPLPFFSLLILYLSYKSTIKNSLKLLFIVGVLLGIAMQLHYLSTFLAFIVFSYLLISEFVLSKAKKIVRLFTVFKKYIFVLVGFVIGWSPFLAFEIRHGFPDFIHIFDFVIHSGNTGASGSFMQIIQDVFFRLFARLVFAYPQIDQLPKFNSLTINTWGYASLIVAIISVLILFINLYKAFKQKSEERNKYLLLTCWLVIGVLLFGFYKKPIYEYYFAFMFPLPFILVGNFITEVSKFKKSKVALLVAGVAVAVLCLVNIQTIPFRYPANRQLNQMRTIADFVFTKSNAKPFNFALISGGNSDYAYRYFFTLWNRPPTTIEFPGADPQRKSIEDQLLVVCESPLPCEPLGNSLWEIAGFGRAEIEGHWKVSVVEVYKLVHYKGK